jgi:uncharacterized Zn finger protein (UPF0148 family)
VRIALEQQSESEEKMAFRACEDCGTALFSDGTCPNCDEEVVIFRQTTDFSFSEEFMELVDEGEERAANRE